MTWKISFVAAVLVLSTVAPGIVAADSPDLSVSVNGDTAASGDEFVVNLNPDFGLEVSSEDSLERVIVRVDGAEQRSFSPEGSSFSESFTIQLTDNSRNEVKVIVRDANGDVSSTQFTVVKDRIAPFIGFDTPFESETGSNPPEQVSVRQSNLTFSGSFQEITSVEVMQIDRRHEYTRAGDTREKVWSTQITDPGSAFSFDAFLGIGQNYLEVKLIDSFDNSRTYVIGIEVIDRTKPSVSLEDVPSKTRSGTVTLEGVASDNVQIDEVTYARSDDGSTSIISSKGVPANEERQSMEFSQDLRLDPGRNVVRIEATDVGGNSRTVRKEIVYNDTVVPRMNLATASLQGGRVSVSGSVAQGSFRRVSVETVATESGETLDLDEVYSGGDTSERIDIDRELSAAVDQPTQVIVRVVDSRGDRHTNTVTVSEENPVVETSDPTTATVTATPTSTAATSTDRTETSTTGTPPTEEVVTESSTEESSEESTPIRVPGLGASQALVALLLLSFLFGRRLDR